LLAFPGRGVRRTLTWNQAVKILIEVGRHPPLGDPECGPWLEPLRDIEDRRLLTKRSIERTMSELTLEECVALVRALTVREAAAEVPKPSTSRSLVPASSGARRRAGPRRGSAGRCRDLHRILTAAA